jgi:tetratricopeptide (TPR) repeat protein
MGIYSHPIATASPEAQKFFDQGLALLYGFNRYEALRSFRRAAELDPNALMPVVGIALALGPHINMDLDGDHQPKESCEAVAKGVAMRGRPPEHERLWIDALASRCPEYDGARYIQAMKRLAARLPDDLDAQTMYAEALMVPVRWRWWNADGTPAAGMAEAVEVLEQVLRRHPDHVGANHFYIHAVEMSPSPERAIASAQRLMGIVPSAGHLVHMPGHIWFILGDYEMTAAVNERAAEVDVDYMRRTGVTSSAYSGYYMHNLQFIAAARAMQGRKADAFAAARKLAEVAAPYIDQMAMMVDAVAPAPLFALLRFQDWNAVLAEPKPHEKLLGSQAIWHHARAIALAAKGRRSEALKEREAFLAAQKKVPADWQWINNKAADLLGIAGLVMEARLASGDTAAVPFLKEAVELQDRLIYDEPPPFHYPVRESLGGALLRAGWLEEAEAVFRDGLRKSLRNGRMLFGLLETLKARGKTAAAELVRREFEAAWKKADVTLRVADL